MLRLHTLGTLDLSGPDSADCAAVLAQPKRLGLLIYLAVSSPRRFHRRDSLLALFWPELDTPHARAALRRTLYFLRNALGPDAIAARGDDEVAVLEKAVWCDAAEFSARLEAGDLARAVDLYRGDLLEGFYVAGAPEYQDWLDRERTRLRDAAARAAWQLAEEAESLDRLDDAARYGRRAAELAPDDEAALRRLLGILDRAGDRAGALRSYDDFARRVSAQFEIEPSGETRSIVEAIRARQPEAEYPSLVMETSPSTLAVFPFAVRGDSQLGYLSEGMVDLLSTQLDGAGDLRTVDPRALLRHVERERWSDQDPMAARAIAAQFSAGRFVLGSIVGAGGRLQATATIYDDAGEPDVSVQAAVASAAEFFELVDDLARQLLGQLSTAPGERLSRIAALTTDSVDALKAYLRGESLLRAGRYYDAMEALQGAVAADETFALAYYRFAAAASGCAMHEFARQLADQGARHRDRLSPHDRLLFDAQRAWLAGDVASAEAHYDTITGTHPDHVEAWFLLGDLLFHSNPLRGRSAVEARVPFERALDLEPDHVASLVHLARIAALEGRMDAAVRIATRVVELSPEGDEVLAMRAFRACASDDAEETAQVVEELRRARVAAIALAFTDIAVYAADLPAAESLARTLMSAARSDEMRALLHILLGHLRFAQRDPAGAMAELRTAEGFDKVWGLEMRALLAALPFGGIPGGEAASARDALLAWDAARAAPSNFVVFAMHNGLHAHLRLYLLALLESRLGNLAEARTHADALAAMQPVTGAESLSRQLIQGARARVLWAEGKAEAALGALEASHGEAWFLLTVASPFYAQAFERFMRAELLSALGRDDQARGWRLSIAERSPYEVIYRES